MRSEYSHLDILMEAHSFQGQVTSHKAKTSTPPELLNQTSTAGARSLCNHANAPQQSRTAQALIPRPKGRPVKLQEDMGLANDQTKFLCICISKSSNVST